MSFLICFVLVFAILSLGVVVHLLRVLFQFTFEVVSATIHLLIDIIRFTIWVIATVVQSVVWLLLLIGGVFLFVIRRIASSIESKIDEIPNGLEPWPTHQAAELSSSNSPRSRRISPQGAMVWSWVAPSCVLALFVLLSDAEYKHLERATAWVRSTILNQQNSAGESISRDRLVPTAWTVPVHQSDEFEKRPEWTSRTKTIVGDIQNTVISSHLWSTEAEATTELNDQVARLVKSDFEANHHGFLDPKGSWPATDEEIARIAVTDRHLERTNQDFGSFTAPMYRMWYHVQLSPIVRTELYPIWKSAVTKNRIVALGAGLACLTLLANLFWMACKLRAGAARRGRYVFAMAALTGVAWVAVSSSMVWRLMS